MLNITISLYIAELRQSAVVELVHFTLTLCINIKYCTIPLLHFHLALQLRPLPPIHQHVCVITKHTDYALSAVGSLKDVGDHGDVCLIITEQTVILSIHCHLLSYIESTKHTPNL